MIKQINFVIQINILKEFIEVKSIQIQLELESFENQKFDVMVNLINKVKLLVIK